MRHPPPPRGAALLVAMVLLSVVDHFFRMGYKDAKDKRAINADAKLKPVFGKDQVTMFELAGIVGKHLG